MAEEHQTLCRISLPTAEEVPILRRRFWGKDGPRAAVIAGVRGDTPEGIRVAHVVSRELAKISDRLTGCVDIYPCVNPLAAHHGARNWPGFDVDLNRCFPGRAAGHAPDRAAAALMDAVAGVEQVVEVRGAHPSFREDTQAIVSADHPLAQERAMGCNVAVVWRRSPELEPQGSLATVLPGLIRLDGGSGNRLTEGVGQDLSDGVLNLLVRLGILPEDDLPFHWAAIRRPLVAADAQVFRVRAAAAGLFLPSGSVGQDVEAGEPLGEIVQPFTGELLSEVCAPRAGKLSALREQPVVYPGTMVARVVTEEEEER